MRKFCCIVLALTAVGYMIFAQSGTKPVAQSQPKATPNTGARAREEKIIHVRADLVYPIDWRDTTAVCFVGNFAAEHNGAVITADSAVRYSDKHIECFGNVMINNKTTYIYGDRAEYNGEINEARVFSSLIKIIDGDATLYTYRFSFNTKDKIGQFSGGGVMTNKDNMLESDRGYYYTNTHELICVERVEMENDTYKMKGDSVVYNTKTDHAQFFRNTNIWNNKKEYLFADRGTYDKAQSLYSLTLNGYILTEKQEGWSDSLDYYREAEHAIFRSNIQIDDAEHKVLAFGDYGEYWKSPGNAVLTRRPSIISYDAEQGDSLFMRGDSMFIYTLSLNDTVATPTASDTVKQSRDVQSADSVQAQAGQPSSIQKSAAADSLTRATGGVDVVGVAQNGNNTTAEQSDEAKTAEPSVEEDLSALSTAERKARLKEIAQKERAEKKLAAEKAHKEKLEQIATRRQAKITAKLDAEKAKEQARDSIRKVKLAIKVKKLEAKAMARAAKRGEKYMPKSDTLQRDSLDSLAIDSLQRDSLSVDSLAIDSLAADTIPRDSIYRLIKAYRNVKIYRSDFQSVCDSLTAISTDSTIHLYIEPVLWNESNQVTSDVMDIYTDRQQIVKAEFVGTPMMVSQIDSACYNQVTGRSMVALFRNNQIYRNDVDGNVRTIYYVQEDGAPTVEQMIVIEAGSMTSYIEDKKLVGLTYRNNTPFTVFPMEMIPATQERFLKGFKWEGPRRPTQNEVFDRRIRPSIREEKTRLSGPTFPIERNITDFRKRLIESGTWADRTDTLSPEITDWVRNPDY